MKNRVLSVLLCGILASCQGADGVDGAMDGEDNEAAIVKASGSTTPTKFDGANGVAIWFKPDDPSGSLIIGSDVQGGLEIYASDGTRVAAIGERPVGLLDIRDGFPLGEREIDLVVGVDSTTSALIAFELVASEPTLHDLSGSLPAPEAEVDGLCLYRSPLSGKFYVFAIADGMVNQLELVDSGDRIDMQHTRAVPVGHGASYCTVDDYRSILYYSHEGVGLFGLYAEPESETHKRLLSGVEPFGPFAGDIKGIAIHDAGRGSRLIVSDADESRFQVYDVEDHRHLGTFQVDGVDESEGVAARGTMVVVADDDNDGEHTNYKIVDWESIAAALSISEEEQPDRPVANNITVKPSVETHPVRSFGDAADDPAIWVNPTDPEQSLIIGAQKQHGVNVYDLSGELLQSRPDGRINNVDLRYDFPLGGESVALVAGSNRTTDGISVWKVDEESRTLVDVADGILDTGMADPYGMCMYRSAVSGDYYVFVNGTDGLMRQWRIEGNDNGKVTVTQVREFKIASQTEGCTADDETGALYVGEEDVGIWKTSAEPDGGDDFVLVDGVGDNGNLTADVEGLAIYYGDNGSGYLVASNQGADNFALYERAGDNRFIGIFHVVANEALGIDGISETDGIDVTSAYLGPDFPGGVFVAQDGRNITPSENQNFKLVPWQRISDAMELTKAGGE